MLNMSTPPADVKSLENARRYNTRRGPKVSYASLFNGDEFVDDEAELSRWIGFKSPKPQGRSEQPKAPRPKSQSTARQGNKIRPLDKTAAKKAQHDASVLDELFRRGAYKDKSTMGYNHVIPASVYARGGRELVPRGRRVVLDPKTGKEKIESYIIDFVTPAAGVPKHN